MIEIKKKKIKKKKKKNLDSIPKTADGYLADSAGEQLRFDPDNQAAPPNCVGIQLCFKVLPHHSSRANTPVIIENVDEFALLFCREFVKRRI